MRTNSQIPRGNVVLKGSGVQEGWTFFENKVKYIGTGHASVPTAEPAGEKTSLAEQSFLRSSGRKKFVDSERSGRQLQATITGVIELLLNCAGTYIRAKAHLEFRLASAVKDIQNAFINTLPAKGRLSRISILCWM